MLDEPAVLALAPDPASAAAGRKLAGGNVWREHASDGNAAWGLCQGSGKTPYQVRVDLRGPAFKCSCPSRKFPCKHAIGLLLKLAREPAIGEPPDWAREWLDSRQENAEKKATDAKPFDAEGEAKKRAARLAKTANELEDLRRWTADLVADGIATVGGRGVAFFEEQARRMVDAKAPGVARMLRDLAAVAAGGRKDWDAAFARGIGRIELLCEAASRAGDLPPDLRRVVEQAVGIPFGLGEVQSTPGTTDGWQCVAQEVEQEDNLRAMRSWLIGEECGRVALVLSFAHGSGPLDARLTPGRRFDGEITFHPGGLRASLPDGDLNPSPVEAWRALPNLTAFADARADALAADPWLERFAAPVAGLRPLAGDALRLLDADGNAMSVAATAAARWHLLAVGGGHPAACVVEWSPAGHRLISVFMAAT